MKSPAAYWSATYAADRRKHRHRCGCGCNTIVQPGTPVVMARVADRKTCVVIADHADRQCDGYTAVERLEAGGMAHLAACGWPSAKAWLDTAPINRPKVA